MKNQTRQRERTKKKKKVNERKRNKKCINKYLAKISGENESKILHYDDFLHQYSSKT